jgi:hypothetical protein
MSDHPAHRSGTAVERRRCGQQQRPNVLAILGWIGGLIFLFVGRTIPTRAERANRSHPEGRHIIFFASALSAPPARPLGPPFTHAGHLLSSRGHWPGIPGPWIAYINSRRPAGESSGEASINQRLRPRGAFFSCCYARAESLANQAFEICSSACSCHS